MRARPLLPLAILLGLAAPAAGADAHYVLRITLDPVTRVADVRIQAPAADAQRRFTVGHGIVLQELRIDGRPANPAAQDVPLPAGRPLQIAYRAVLPTLASARARRGLSAFADPEGSMLPLLDWLGAANTFTYDLTLEAPSPQRAVAPGRLLEERQADGRYVARFAFDKPARELIVFAGPYEVGETMHGSLRLRTYFPREAAHLGARYRAQVARYIDRYSEQIGAYPHSDFHVVASPLPLGVGFSTLTYVSRQILHLAFMQERSLAHEVLHAWWGLSVAVDYAQGNWAEALTTFMADYALAEDADEAQAREMRRRWLSDFAVLPSAQDRPLAAFVVRGHAASQVIGYNKGAMLFLMLRDEVGQGVFAAGLRRFWREHRFKRAGWSDLRAAFEAEAQRPLDRFFRQWLERPGAPQLALRDAERAPSGDVRFTLTQTAPPYALAVPVVIDTRAGPERHVVRLHAREQGFTLRPAARATALRVDPDYRLFRRLRPEDVPPIIRSLVVAPAAVTVAADAPEAARQVAEALLEGGVRLSSLEQAVGSRAPVLLVGTTPAVRAALARAGLPERPASLGQRGTARVWAARYAGDAPMLVVEGDDAQALRTVAPALRHYGSSSYLVFEGRRVSDRGVWPPAGRSLQAQLPN